MSRPPRVLVLSERAVRGGAETSSILIAAGLAEHGISASIAFGRKGPLVDDARRLGVPMTLGGGGTLPNRFRVRVPFLCLSSRFGPYDLVHASSVDQRSTWAASQALAAGRPTVAHLRLPAQLDRTHQLHRRGATVITNSTATQRELQGRGDDRVHFVPNGIDVEAYRARVRPGDRERTRGALGVPADAPVLLVLANVAPYKGLDLLYPALLDALAAQPDLHVLHAGAAAYASSVPYGEALRATVAASPAGARLHQLGSRKDVPQLIEAADVVVVPSLGEGTARAILEAWSLERPVLVADADGLVDLVEDDVTGVLVHMADREDTRDRVLGLMRDDERRRRLARAGSQAVQQRFTHVHHLERVLSVYQGAGLDLAAAGRP